MTFRLISKKTGEDVTDTINPCLHHTGKLILLMGNGEWREIDENDYRIKHLSPINNKRRLINGNVHD